MLRILKRKFHSLMYRAATKGFRFFERLLHLHVTPVHFYSPIPDTRDLDGKVFGKVFDCVGLDFNPDGHLRQIREVFPRYAAEYTPRENTGLTLVDSFILHAMIREAKPKVMIEVGCGETTRISLQALELNEREGAACRFYAVEPYPQDFLRRIERPGFTLIERKVEEVEVDLLASADLLFIDSSHVSRIGGDVNYELLEVVPRLKQGTLVHWHDILIPRNYWKDWVLEGNKFWNESYMVHAFLLFNNAFEVLWASQYMQTHNAEALQEAFPYFRPNEHRCTSLWVRKTKDSA